MKENTFKKHLLLIFSFLIYIAFGSSEVIADIPSLVKPTWGLDSKGITLEMINPTKESILVTSNPRFFFESSGVSLDLDGYLDKDDVIAIYVIFKSAGKHPGIAAGDRGGLVFPPKVIPPGGDVKMSFRLDSEFIKAASASSSVQCVLKYKGKIIGSTDIPINPNMFVKGKI